MGAGEGKELDDVGWGVLNPLLSCDLQPLRMVTNEDGNYIPRASGPMGGNCGLLKYNSLLD